MARTAAPTMPAAPAWTYFDEAALEVWEPPAAELVFDPEELLAGFVEVEAAVVAEPVVIAVVEPALVGGGTTADVVPAPVEEEPLLAEVEPPPPGVESG